MPEQLSARELDAAIAVELGWTVYGHNHLGEIDVWTMPDGQQFSSARFSTDGNAMLELIGEMRDRQWLISINTCTDGFVATGREFFTEGQQPRTGIVQETDGDGVRCAPQAVARAALAALLAGKEGAK